MTARIKCFISLGGLAAIALSFYLVFNSSKQTNGSHRRTGGVYRIAIPSYPTTLDPIKSDWPISMQVLNAVNVTLVRVEANGDLAPHVAKSWTISEDRKKYTFYIRDNITFHNGRRLTVDDVVGSLQRILGVESLYRDNLRMIVDYEDYISGKTKKIDGIRKISDDSFEINLKYPFEPLLAMLSSVSFSILPIQEIKDAPNFFRSPIGAGPFQWSEKSDADKITLQAYEQYFNGRPNLESVHFLVQPDNKDQMDQVYSLGDLETQENPGSEDYTQVPINEMRTHVISFNTSRAPFTDKRVREAIRCVLNLTKIYVKLKHHASIHPTSSYIPKGMLGYDPDLQPVECSVEQAKRLLREAGFNHSKDMGTVSFATRLPKPAGEAVVAEIKRGFQLLGIPLDVDKSWVSLEKDLARGTAPDIFFIGYAPNYPDPFFLLNYFHSASIGFTNGSRYNNKEYDKLVDRSVSAGDYQERGRILRKLNRMLVEDTVIIPVYAGSSHSGEFKKKVKGLEFPYVNLPFPRLEKIWIDL